MWYGYSMKKIIITTLCAGLLLPACKHSSTTSAPVRPAAAPIAAPVQTGAPASLAGKTIVFDYSRAQERDLLGMGSWSAASRGSDVLKGSQVSYRRTGAKTAQLGWCPNPDSANANMFDFSLMFTTPTSGTATMEATVRHGSSEYRNIRFTIR